MIKEYWLQSDPQQKGWGPFNSSDEAWKYLFGHYPTEEEIKKHENAGWYVGYFNKWNTAQRAVLRAR